MLGVAVVLFALAALLGITLAAKHLKKKDASTWQSILE
jgi:hypothetical protein